MFRHTSEMLNRARWRDLNRPRGPEKLFGAQARVCAAPAAVALRFGLAKSDDFTETLPANYRLAGIVTSQVARLCCSLKIVLKNPPSGQESVAEASGTCLSPFLD